MIHTPTLHGLPVFDAAPEGFESITEKISLKTEANLAAGVAQHRDPAKSCFVRVAKNAVELYVTARSHVPDARNLLRRRAAAANVGG